MKKIDLMYMALILLLLSGCGLTAGANLEQMQSLPLTISEEVYEAPVDVVLTAVKESLTEADLHIEEIKQVDDKETSIIAHHYYDITSGQFVRIILKERGDGDDKKTYLYYDSRKEYDMNVMADLWSMKKKIMLYINDYMEVYSMYQS